MILIQIHIRLLYSVMRLELAVLGLWENLRASITYTMAKLGMFGLHLNG